MEEEPAAWTATRCPQTHGDSGTGCDISGSEIDSHSGPRPNPTSSVSTRQSNGCVAPSNTGTPGAFPFPRASEPLTAFVESGLEA